MIMNSVRSFVAKLSSASFSQRISKAHGVLQNTASPLEPHFPRWATATAIAAATLGCSAVAFSESPEIKIKPPDVWDRWDQVKSFLTSWKKSTGTAVPLPVDKLACHRIAGSSSSSGGSSGSSTVTSPPPPPVVLVSCGSFNPPTVMHLRMMELARQEMMARGFDVMGAYLSPVNDAYWKKDLVNGRHRVRMCQHATTYSEFIMVDAWEVGQQQYTRTLHVLQHLQRRLSEMFAQSSNVHPLQGCGDGSPLEQQPRTVLVCGADVVETMVDASIWKQDLLEKLLKEHGLVCISRDGAGANAAWLLGQPGTLLHQYRENVVFVQDPVPNEVSSSAVRRELEAGRSVKYLVPPGVEEYIRKHGLYGTGKKK